MRGRVGDVIPDACGHFVVAHRDRLNVQSPYQVSASLIQRMATRHIMCDGPAVNEVREVLDVNSQGADQRRAENVESFPQAGNIDGATFSSQGLIPQARLGGIGPPLAACARAYPSGRLWTFPAPLNQSLFRCAGRLCIQPKPIQSPPSKGPALPLG